ncbi:MAG TPA: hypothetical protein VFR81_30215 [Longimicrobium sp.]|nr:hypothetical protein [Longimicrobium sp.]
MTAVLVLIFALMLVAPLAASHYLARLPYAPECPRCRAVTSPPSRIGAADRLYARLAATSVRRCGRCGWGGRMRWRLAEERIRRHGHG